ncbi:MAG: DUF2202 domain-containing protein [Bacteroidales bacterium]|nr:DUF2202 domain-containing protein [Lentimicrobiaceae bacterium]MDD5694431.1 DUF2202 domain-containing protein [Bacteroidales bacterium]
MKTKRNFFILLLPAIIMISLAFLGCSKAVDESTPDLTTAELKETILLTGFFEPVPMGSANNCIDNFPVEDLSEEEVQALMHMREEELLAKDVYTFAYGLYPIPVFNNISKSETQHTGMVKLLIEKYELDDPGEGHQAGVFVNPELQELYNELTDLADNSLIEALTAGATFEDLDIFDLKNLLENVVDNQDIAFVFGNLERGSRNHMRAFYRNLVFRGADYTPQYISQEYFDEIIGSGHEPGFGGCQGMTTL